MNETNTKIESIIAGLTKSEKDSLYRALWIEYVEDDVSDYCEDNGINCPDELIDAVADDYVYNGEYDCNLTYWNNIGNLVRKHRNELGLVDSDDEEDEDEDDEYDDDYDEE